MTKELEALEKLLSFAFVMSENMVGLTKGNYDADYFIKKTYEYLHKYSVDLHTELALKKALQRLEAIDNSNPSEALKCLEDIYRNAVFINEKQEIQNKHKIFIESPETNKTISEQCNTIKQALLKAQGQESKIEILKEYRKDYLDRLKNLEKYSQEQEKENAEYKQLEKELGCPLDEAVDILLTLKNHMKIDFDSYDDGDEWDISEYVDFNGEGLQFKDRETEMKVIEWLKKYKSE